MANFNFNKVIMGGRLCAEPELRQTPQGIPVAGFRIAVNRRAPKSDEAMNGAVPPKPVADFFDCVAWRGLAEHISRYYHKGSSICLAGSLQVRNWDDPQGVKRYATEIIVDEVTFVDTAAEARALGGNGGSYPSLYGTQPYTGGGAQPSYTAQPYGVTPPSNDNQQANPMPPFTPSGTDDAALRFDPTNIPAADDDLPF